MLAEAIVLIPKSANKGTEIQMDVLPLVLCKDCKHCDEIDMYGYIQCDKAETHEPNFYCADGERKE